jgi:hypothetical protein
MSLSSPESLNSGLPHLQFSIQLIYLDDASFPGGNDYPAEVAGVVSIPVKGPADTNLVISTILAYLGDK